MSASATLRPVFPAAGRYGYRYWEDDEGGLWGAGPSQEPRLLARKGKWRPAVGGAQQGRPRRAAPVAPVAAPPVPPAHRGRRRYSFAFNGTLHGVAGIITIEVPTLREVAEALAEMVEYGFAQPAAPEVPNGSFE